MPARSLIRSIEECMDARAALEESRQCGAGVGPALERARRASSDLASEVEAAQRWAAHEPTVKPLVDAVRRYMQAEAVVETGAGDGTSPASAFEALYYARRGLATQLRAYRLIDGITEPQAAEEAGAQAALGPRMIIAIDGSLPSTWAIQFGGQLAEALGAYVLLLHVGEPVAADGNELVFATSQLQEEHRELHVHWRELLARARRALPAGVAAETLLRSGSPATEIIRVARAWQADLIVMGTRGRGRLAQFLLGSVAEAVVRTAACPVLTTGHEPARSNPFRQPA